MISFPGLVDGTLNPLPPYTGGTVASWSGQQFFPGQTLQALGGLVSRSSAEHLVRMLRGYASGMDPNIPNPPIRVEPRVIGLYTPAAVAAEMTRLRVCADAIEAKIAKGDYRDA